MKKMRITFVFIFWLIILGAAQAQQEAIYSQYLFDKMAINPAFVGSSNWAMGTMK